MGTERKKEKEERQEITCSHCGTRFIPYDRMQYEECPRCGLPARGRVKRVKTGGRRKKLAYLFLVSGVIILVLIVVLYFVKKG